MDGGAVDRFVPSRLRVFSRKGLGLRPEERRRIWRGRRRRFGPESEWGPVSPPAPTCPSFDCRRWVARPSLAGRLWIARRARGPLRFPPDPGARPRSPVRVPVGLGRDPKVPHRSPSGRLDRTEILTVASLPDRTRPKPRPLQGSHRSRSLSGRPFERRWVETVPPLEEFLEAEALRNPLSDRSSARRPCRSPGAPVRGRSLFEEPL